MARSDERDGICRAGPRHCPHRRRLSDGAGDVAVRACAAVRNAAQFFPDTSLEGCRLNIQRQVERNLLSGKMPQDQLNPFTERNIIPANVGGGELIREHVFKFRVGITQADGA